MRLTAAKALAESLSKLGVRRVYGLIGTSILDFIDTLYDYRDSIRFITTRHEQVAVSMADAEGRLTGMPGVAVVHVGGGFLNSLTSLGIAYKDSSPLVLISGAVRNRVAGLDAMYEVDQLAMAKPITKAQYRVDEPSKMVDAVADAFKVALSPPMGPVYIEVREDVWGLSHDYSLDGLDASPVYPPEPSDEEIARVIEYIEASERPLILVGGGVNNPRSSRLLLRLVELIGAPVASTGNGRGAFPETHRYSIGRVGFGGGSTYADKALEESDLVITLGCGLSEITTYSFNIMPRGEIILVTLEEKTELRPVPYSEWFKVDANIFLEKLVKVLEERGFRREYTGWWREIEAWRSGWEAIVRDCVDRVYDGYVSPGRFFKKLGEMIEPTKTIITAGQGMHILYTYALIKVGRPRGFLAATNMGSMAFAFPAALAAKLCQPDNQVIAVLGDGEFMMTVQDLETAVRENIPVKIVVVNDNSYRVLYYRQKLQKGGRLIGTLLSNPDFKLLADAFGVPGRVVSDNGDIDGAIEEMIESDSPYLLELRIHPDDIPPLNLDASLRMTTL